MSQQTFFSKIDSTKMLEVIEFLIHNGTELVLKVKNQHYKSKILSRRTTTLFEIYKFSFISFLNEEVTCSFEIREEKYFFKSVLTSTNAEFKILIPKEIFQLQRRSDFRVTVPIGVAYTCEIVRINDMRGSYLVELRDISLGGCQIAYPSKAFKLSDNDEVILKLKMNQFENEKIITFVKHIKTIPAVETNLVGLRFDTPDAAFLTELQGLLVNLDRIHRGKSYD